ncbi:inositol hexaphosphate kinase KCS1 [Aspergillus terreus]|uniref:Kinase n=1 Tax=Aspergillus terreus TaxID=33178 RepID=A0A5M3Z5A2_ASPTE|nr:hypothetical protein ATETN484_0009057000 [Aspergillus terreus]GFF18021.1 inositol hexaphosphate kinase KCS1 [Aspergillus terreus]
MSRPPSASESTLSRPLVTPAASAQHDCSNGPDLPHPKPRRHHVWDQHHHPPEAPSPSRAESPTAHQWAKPASSFALKRASTAPLEKFPRPHSPQLSERDSIFATHYLPSDPEATTTTTTPQLPPVEDAAENDGPGALNLASANDAAASPVPIPSTKVPPRPSIVDSFHMEVDRRVPVPLRSPSLLSSTLPAPDLPALPSRPDSHLQKPHEVLDRSVHLPAWESMQPLRKISSDGAATGPSPVEEKRSVASAPLKDPALDHPPTVPTRETSGTWSERSSRENTLDGPGERSSSRSRRGRVESSIEANLTNAELASHVRSRKSSHYLGLFKENTTSPDRKRREDRGRWYDETSEAHDSQPQQMGQSDLFHAGEQTTSPTEAPFALEHTGLKRNSKSLSQLSLIDHPQFAPPSEAERSPRDEVMKSPRRVLPRSLLEEIRNFHLTPGGARGTSFSKSIPTQYAEGGRDYITAKEEPQFDHLSPSSGPDTGPRRGSAQFEDEEDEQISSAVYFPHERVTVSDEVDQVQPFADDRPGAEPYQVSPTKSNLGLVSKRHSLVDEPEAHHVDISLRSKNDSRILHGDLQEIQAPQLEELTEKSLNAISERSGEESTCGESEYDSGISVQDEASSLTDEAEVTPTATPTQRHRTLRPRRTHGSSGPLGAVELKPYRHQVGGHTTVFRFSRRAVCKQLNNRENEFYERIERRHPDMLMFLPRYIGVLNVTFSKNSKKQKPIPEGAKGRTDSNKTGDSNKHQDATSLTVPLSHDATDQPRIFSQKQVTGIIPKVILENNRHIIPADLFSRSQRPRTADGTMPARHRFSQSAGVISRGKQSTGSWDDKHTQALTKPKVSWGATTVNRQLQEQVLREVFSPPAIHHHRRHARGHVNLPRTISDGIHRRANLSEDQTASSRRNAPTPPEPPRSAAIDIVKQSNEGPGLSSSASTALDATHNRLEQIRSQGSPPRSSSLSRARQVRRRHSGSGLQRRGSMTPGKGGGELMFFEDDGYGGDREDEIFAMEGDASMARSRDHSQHTADSGVPKIATTGATDISGRSNGDSSKSPSRLQVKDDSRVQLPANPKEAQTRKDERVQFFLLLEDLTAGMNKPCVLDLKMGTRQYGIEADEKKRKSQRRKCQSTTSQQLGVRLCGMQTWNVKKQEYSFEDKYFGRDLKSGREFQDALTRFLYDGVSYNSVAKKIPVILEKLAKLENMIRRLKRYRLYASSLLILYDGEQTSSERSMPTDTHVATKRGILPRRASEDGHNNEDVQLKIVDFANCVTGEDEIPPTAPCPPQHPDDIDRGYLRGLRTLRMYFQRILKEVSHDEYIERGEGEAIAMRSQVSGHDDTSDRYWDEGVMESDPGEVSF